MRLKFKKTSEFLTDGNYVTEVNGIRYKVFRASDMDNNWEWYFHRDTPEDYKKYVDKYVLGYRPSFLENRKMVEEAIISDSKNNN